MNMTKFLSIQCAVIGRRVFTAMALIFALALFANANAADPTQPFCIPQSTGVPGGASFPTINGTVSDDLGWTNARRHVFVNGTPVYDVSIQGLRDASFLYFSFEVNHDSQFDVDDAIYVAFDPTGMAADRRLLRINPVIPSGAASPVSIKHWHGFPWVGLGDSPPAGTVVAATTSGTAPNVSWFVELKIPRGAFGIPASGPFGIYFNVVPQMDDIAFHYQYRWPEGTAVMAGNPLSAAASWADTSRWGQATTAATTCNGVYIGSSDIRTDNVPSSKINLNAPNTFRVTAHNSTVNAAGAAIDANNVRATFKIANFGLPSQWTPINATAPATNPTSSGNIAAGGTRDFTTQWTLNATEQTQYDTAATRHQCILVELDTNPLTSTLFATKSAWTNMNFGLASKFESNAVIDPRGWPKTVDGKPHSIELVVTSRTDELKPKEVLDQMKPVEGREQLRRVLASDGSWKSLAEPMHFPVERDESWKEFVGKLEVQSARVSQSTYLFHGCRHTGIFLDLGGGQKSELCERVGSYGYVVRHASLGQPIAWNLDVEGQELKRNPKRPGSYQMTVSQPVAVRGNIVASEQEPGSEAGGKPNGSCGTFSGMTKVGANGGGGTLAASLLMVGGLGVGGLAFLRRRKPESAEVEDKETQS